jgi:hypothetical protein
MPTVSPHPRAGTPWSAVFGLVLMVIAVAGLALLNLEAPPAIIAKIGGAVLVLGLAFVVRRFLSKRRKARHGFGPGKAAPPPRDESNDDFAFDPHQFAGADQGPADARAGKLQALRDHENTPPHERDAADAALKRLAGPAGAGPDTRR